MDATGYYLNIARARLALSDAPAAVAGTVGGRRTTRAGWGAYTVFDETNPVTLLFKLDNLYLEGFRNSSNQVFLHKHSGYAINADKKLPFSNEYGQLDYNRQLAITITVDNINGALAQFYNATTGGNGNNLKKSFLILAIGFAEAMRFDDVLSWIGKGEPITDLDWDKHKDQSKIRIIQS